MAANLPLLIAKTDPCCFGESPDRLEGKKRYSFKPIGQSVNKLSGLLTDPPSSKKKIPPLLQREALKVSMRTIVC